jgi:hypothetical protein
MKIKRISLKNNNWVVEYEEGETVADMKPIDIETPKAKSEKSAKKD